MRLLFSIWYHYLVQVLEKEESEYVQRSRKKSEIKYLSIQFQAWEVIEMKFFVHSEKMPRPEGEGCYKQPTVSFTLDCFIDLFAM